MEPRAVASSESAPSTPIVVSLPPDLRTSRVPSGQDVRQARADVEEDQVVARRDDGAELRQRGAQTAEPHVRTTDVVLRAVAVVCVYTRVVEELDAATPGGRQHEARPRSSWSSLELRVSAAIIEQRTPIQRLGAVETRDAQGVVTRLYALDDGALEVCQRVVEQDDPLFAA